MTTMGEHQQSTDRPHPPIRLLVPVRHGWKVYVDGVEEHNPTQPKPGPMMRVRIRLVDIAADLMIEGIVRCAEVGRARKARRSRRARRAAYRRKV